MRDNDFIESKRTSIRRASKEALLEEHKRVWRETFAAASSGLATNTTELSYQLAVSWANRAVEEYDKKFNGK